MFKIFLMNVVSLPMGNVEVANLLHVKKLRYRGDAVRFHRVHSYILTLPELLILQYWPVTGSIIKSPCSGINFPVNSSERYHNVTTKITWNCHEL